MLLSPGVLTWYQPASGGKGKQDKAARSPQVWLWPLHLKFAFVERLVKNRGLPSGSWGPLWRESFQQGGMEGPCPTPAAAVNTDGYPALTLGSSLCLGLCFPQPIRPPESKLFHIRPKWTNARMAWLVPLSSAAASSSSWHTHLSPFLILCLTGWWQEEVEQRLWTQTKLDLNTSSAP
jgi:hypothetical protein